MAMAMAAAEGEPMMDINTTPLIDVMLVLLIMFIITIPVQTHAVKLDLPVDHPNQPKPADRSGEEHRHDRSGGHGLLERIAGRSGHAASVSRSHQEPDPRAG